MLYDMKKTTSDNPNCCQLEGCNLLAVEGCTHCAAHGGAKQASALQKQATRTYNLTKYREQLNRFSDDDNIKGLREEIGILRILMEERLNLCNTSIDLLAHAHTISDLAVKIEKLVTSCNKIEKSLGKYLDKNDIVQLGMEIVTIITRHIDNVDVIEKIANELAIVIERIMNKEANEE